MGCERRITEYVPPLVARTGKGVGLSEKRQREVHTYREEERKSGGCVSRRPCWLPGSVGTAGRGQSQPRDGRTGVPGGGGGLVACRSRSLCTAACSPFLMPRRVWKGDGAGAAGGRWEGVGRGTGSVPRGPWGNQ